MLGPVEVRINGAGPVPIGGFRQRALLAILALHANEAVATDRLIDELWGERPPATATHTIQVFVSRLRGALADASSRLVTRPPGYMLEIQLDELDAERCEHLYARARAALDAGDAARAVELLREAEGLWRGSPLSEFTYEPFAQAAIARLEELRLGCREELIEAELALGHHDGVVAGLEALVREHPFRERPRGQLMIALYRCGRQADALDAFRQARHALLEELGVEPSNALRELEAAILRQDDLLRARVNSRAPLPAALPASGAMPASAVSGVMLAPDASVSDAVAVEKPRSLVGRSGERLLLRRSLDDAAEGRPSLALVAGEAGIGKTRLVKDLVEHANAADAAVLWGECLPLAGEDFPYCGITSALRSADRPTLDAGLSVLPFRGRQELGRAFPDVITEASEDERFDQPVPQSRLFGWLLAVIRALARDRSMLLVIEDMHWADRSTRDFIHYLIRNLRSERLAVVVTVRDDEPRPDMDVRKFLSELVRDERVNRIDLPPLTMEEVALQLNGLLGHEPPVALVRSLSGRADGNPFYVEALLDTVVADGAIPPTIRDALLLIVEDLSPSAQELVRVCALSGRPIGHKVLSAAVDLPERDFRSALREAIENHVLVADQDTGHFRCRHMLLAETVQADLNAAESTALHAAVAHALEEAAEQPHPAELAWHWESAGCLRPALRASFAAGRWSSGMSAYHEAVRHFEHAASLWTRCDPSDAEFDFDLVEILSQTAEAARWTGDFDRALALCREALDGVDEVQEPARAAALYERMGRYQPWDIDAVRAGYAQALALLPTNPTVQRARLLAADALALIWDARWSDAKPRAGEALTTALAAKGRAEEGSARAALGIATAFLGDAPTGEQELRKALALVQRFGTTEEVATVRLILGAVLRLTGKTADASTVMEEGAREASIHGADAYASFMAVSAVDDQFTIGRWDGIEERLATINDVALSLTGRVLLATLRGRLETARGRLDEAAAAFRAAKEMTSADLPSDFGTVLHTGLAELELARGRLDAAAALVSEGVRALGDRRDPLYAPALFSLGVRAEAELACSSATSDQSGRSGEQGKDEEPAATRRADRAKALLKQLRGLASTYAAGPAPLPLVEAHLAQAEAEAIRLEGGSTDEAWADVANRWSTVGHLPAYVYARSMEADALLKRGADHSRAAVALRDALSAAEQLGSGELVNRVNALARAGDEAMRSS